MTKARRPVVSAERRDWAERIVHHLVQLATTTIRGDFHGMPIQKKYGTIVREVFTHVVRIVSG